MPAPQHADVSDDDFDIIEPAQPVSAPSSPQYRENSTSSARPLPDLKPLSPTPPEADAETQPGDGARPAQSLPGRPPPPSVHDCGDVFAPLPSQGGDEGRTLSPHHHHAAEQPRSSDSGSHGIPGLKYTKSVVQKLWGSKDALIAVMG